MKKKLRLILNSSSSLLFQLIYIVYGFVLPKLILQAYGSEVNGIISSIMQYLSIISLTEFGMTAVVQSSLYKPLIDNDYVAISKIMTSANKFFKRLGAIFLLYTISLCLIYPRIITTSFNDSYVILLIVILSVNTLVEYVFGLTNNQLIAANQDIYITQFTKTVMFILNIAVTFVLININVSIHFLKLVSCFIMLANPIVSALYIFKKYPTVNKRTSYDIEPIKQKWNGISQHLSSYVYSSTDVIVLSLFASLKSVSIYAVHNMVLNGLKQLTGMFDNSVRPILGNLWAKNDHKLLKKYFEYYEIALNVYSIIVFGCCANLIGPFVMTYTRGITDTNYNVPLFAFIFSIACLMQNLKNAYHTLVQSVGGFKETQVGYAVTAIINVVISLSLVPKFGLVGVAIGTLVAAGYQLFYLMIFAYRKVFVDSSIITSAKIYIVDIVIFLLAWFACRRFAILEYTYLCWFVLAIKVFFVWCGITIVFYMLVFKDKISPILQFVIKKR